jgi:transposase-like protein
MMRNKYSKTEKQEWIQKFQASGLTVKKFSEKYGVNFHSLSAWLYVQKRKPEFNFVPIIKEKTQTPIPNIIVSQDDRDLQAKISLKFNFKIRILNLISFRWKSSFNRNFL